MNPTLLLIEYTKWHYGRAFVSLFLHWMNGLWFTARFFSVFLLLRTLLSPWKRLHETSTGGLDLQIFFDRLIVNTLMRLVGAFFRIIVIAVGLVALAAVLLGGALFILIWFAAPVVILVLLFNTLVLLF